MDGHKQQLTYLIEGKKTRFVIPVYQRNYDWKTEQCGRLFDDLEDVILADRPEHFFGSIVSQTPRNERVVIDGQQRITTVFLLFAALKHQLEAGVVTSEDDDLAGDIDDYYLVDRKHVKDQKLRLKLVKNDSNAFAAVLSGDDGKLIKGSNVTQNYTYFLDRISKMRISADELYEALQRLQVIDITLDYGDDAQLIFESLNSTGLDLSEGDKIRNFILMNLTQDVQEDYYENYWNVIEENTKYQVSDFVRFYLAAMDGKTPAMRNVYPAFRKYAEGAYHQDGAAPGVIDTKSLLEKMLRYSRHYSALARPKTGNADLDRVLRRLSVMDMSVIYPFLLNLLEYRERGTIGDGDTASVLKIVESYLFRRWACGEPTNALNKIFETLHQDALKGVREGASYLDALTYVITHKGGKGRFPDDHEFVASLHERDWYAIQNRKLYLYDRLENGDSDERVSVVARLQDDTYSVEHVMPQTLSDSWKASLGTDWERIHGEWLNCLANLTITAYNSEYSNRDFATKRDMKDGFSDSGFRVSKWIAQQDTWGEDQLKQRERRLAKRLLELWPMPTTSYIPREVIPDVQTLGDDFDFTGRRISAFTFLGVRYPTKQWNEMEESVLRQVFELDSATLFRYLEQDGWPASSFSDHEQHYFSKIADGLYARTSSSTSWKIELLRRVFDDCGIDQDELSFEMPPVTK